MNFSLGKKTFLLIVCIAAVISTLAILIYSKGIRDVITSQYEARSIDISQLVAGQIDTGKLANVQKAILEIYNKADNKVQSDQWGRPEFDAYVAQYAPIEEMEDYQTLRKDLRKMQDVLDVDCLYITWLDSENECYLYMIDAAYENACPIGCIDPIYVDLTEFKKNPEIFYAPNISNTPEYGWLIATGTPIEDENGNTIGISGVDISMNEIVAQNDRFLFYVVMAFLTLTVIVSVIGIALVNHVIVKPINKLSRAAAQYKDNRKVFSELQMKSGDEIGTLAESMAQMENEINGYIANLEQTTSDLITAREHAELMNRAANIDALTKVRNKRAFDVEVERLNAGQQPYGIAMIDLNGLKEINDNYGHEKGDISIKMLCQIICQMFKHSPVYRVGGDEFIVILENGDYVEREALIRDIKETFRRNMEDTSLPPWERVSAAVGYAVHEPGSNERVENVQQRADEAMYENKKAMKAERKL